MNAVLLAFATAASAADATGLHLDGVEPQTFLSVPEVGGREGSVAAGAMFSWLGESAVIRASNGEEEPLLAGVALLDVGAMWSPTRRLRVDLGVPVIAFAEVGESDGGRLGDGWLRASYAVFDSKSVQLGPRVTATIPIAPYGPLTTAGGVAGEATWVAAVQFASFRLGAEAGVGYSPPSSLGGNPLTQGLESGGWTLPWGVAGRMHVAGPFSVGAELGGELAIDSPAAMIVPHRAEALAHIGLAIGDLEVLAGGGGGLTGAFGVPDGRGFLGVRGRVFTTPKLRPDVDADGVADERDRCTAEAEDGDGFEDEDGCPDLDNDRDDVADLGDRCPLDPEDRDGYFDADGCPEADNDRDGLADKDDNCPNLAGLTTMEGCPANPERVTVEGRLIRLQQEVFFQTGVAVLRPEAFPVLAEIASAILSDPTIRLVQIAGHTDDVGDPDTNAALSMARASTVRAFLVEQCGLDPARIEARGFGESMPISDNETVEGRAANRRVVFVVARRL